MDTVVQRVGAWAVESAQLDFDGTGPRQWNRVIRPGQVECWCTTSELRALLRDAGLDIADLVVGQPLQCLDGPDGPGGPARAGAGRRSAAEPRQPRVSAPDPHEPDLREPDPRRPLGSGEDPPDDTDDECE